MRMNVYIGGEGRTARGSLIVDEKRRRREPGCDFWLFFVLVSHQSESEAQTGCL